MLILWVCGLGRREEGGVGSNGETFHRGGQKNI